MPALKAESALSVLPNNTNSSLDLPARKSNDKTISGVFTYTNGTDVETGLPEHRLEQIKTLKGGSQSSLANGNVKSGRDRAPSITGSTLSASSKGPRNVDYFSRPYSSTEVPTRLASVENASDATRMNGSLHQPAQSPGYSTWTHSVITQNDSEYGGDGAPTQQESRVNSKHHLVASPPAMSPIISSEEPQLEPIKSSAEHTRQAQRHTLSVPQSTPGAARASRDFSYTSGPSEEVLHTSGRFSPTRDADGNTVRRRRQSLGLARRSTRATSDANLEEVPDDEEAARWTEVIKAKRASRRKRLEEDDDDRVVVGNKVQEGHANWVTAYNMLTGIRFTVSRANAKIEQPLNDSDFDIKQKLSFDVMGSEQTPGSKYDFKFKDYAPMVFRSLRRQFGLDPADYLMSLTSKYILSELGSPGKSGSFFYFSRDYKYIIKTIHHAEHKLMRRILRDYYNHVKDNPNTLISQFYGLHRVKMAYGRKIHFVVMNNLFPPHRDIHQTFDLKGSTIGRDFKEDNLASNPRATLKDLNWLRREQHLEFDQRLREVFIQQLQRDVALLQRLEIMDYSLLVGMHDLEKGNDDNVREKTLQVFQPGGERDEDDLPGHLTRTPSRLESARKARELRQTLKKEKPVPMGLSAARMPTYISPEDQRHNRVFYGDDGGIRATHEDGRPGETIYYLGVIDCLTHYGFVKRVEHFWKGLSHNRHQISPIPPHAYGERFLNFMTGTTMTREEATKRAEVQGTQHEMEEVNAHNTMHHHHIPPKPSLDGADGHVVPPHSPRDDAEVEATIHAAQKSTDKQTGEKGRRRSEDEKPDRTLLTQSNDARHSTTLPIVQEARENSSQNSSRNGDAEEQYDEKTQFTDDGPSQEPERNPGAQQAKSHEPTSQHADHAQQGKYAEPTVEYTVTEDNKRHFHRRHDHMKAPLDAQVQEEPEINGIDGVKDTDDLSRRISKPPRLGSGIIPTLTPLYKEEEIGIAK